MHPVHVTMDDVEIGGPFGNRLKKDGTNRSRVRPWPTQAQRAGKDWNQFGAGPGVPTRKQRHIMARANQILRQPGDHTLSATVQFWRYALSQGGDLRDAHCSFPGFVNWPDLSFAREDNPAAGHWFMVGSAIRHIGPPM